MWLTHIAHDRTGHLRLAQKGHHPRTGGTPSEWTTPPRALHQGPHTSDEEGG